MLKKILFIFSLTFICLNVKAQTPVDTLGTASLSNPAPVFPTENKWGIKFGGFVNTQIYWDTRQSENSRETMLLFYPKNEELDAEGNDINAAPSMNQLAIISRLSGAISGPNVLGAKFRGLLEADFSGQSNGTINLFRLRHAFILLDWKNSDLLIGQTWHPMNVPEMMPGLSPLNNGAPFHAFSRHVQVRYIYRVAGLRFIATAAAQRDNSNNGPEGASSNYLINSAIPNFDLQVQYRNGAHLVGFGGDYKVLKPRLSATFNGEKYKQDDLVPSFAAIAFWNYKMPKWNLKLEAVWGQNQFEHLMLGGIAETADTLNHSYTYTNLDQFSIWSEISKSTGKWRPGLFVGFAKNLGYSDEMGVNSVFWGRGGNIDHVYRVSPRLSFFASEKLIFTAEVEYTAAGYGTTSKTSGLVSSPKDVSMFRFLFDATYHF